MIFIDTKKKENIIVHHFPPGAGKWNKVEHRLFSYISKNWRGRPLVNMATVVNLIANTKTETGMTVRCVEDKNICKKELKLPMPNGKKLIPNQHHFTAIGTITSKRMKISKIICAK